MAPLELAELSWLAGWTCKQNFLQTTTLPPLPSFFALLSAFISIQLNVEFSTAIVRIFFADEP
jgi:hypothetical protein